MENNDLSERIVVENIAGFIKGLQEHFNVGDGEIPGTLAEFNEQIRTVTMEGLPTGLIGAVNAYFLHPRGLCLVVGEIGKTADAPGVMVPMLVFLKDSSKVFSYRKEVLPGTKDKLKQFDAWAKRSLRSGAQGFDRVIELQQLDLFADPSPAEPSEQS